MTRLWQVCVLGLPAKLAPQDSVTISGSSVCTESQTTALFEKLLGPLQLLLSTSLLRI